MQGLQDSGTRKRLPLRRRAARRGAKNATWSLRQRADKPKTGFDRHLGWQRLGEDAEIGALAPIRIFYCNALRRCS